MRRVLPVFLAVFFAVPAAAFDYDEHKYLSNIALRAALALAPCTPAWEQVELFIDPGTIQEPRLRAPQLFDV